jgi:hypothetical protein
MRAFHLVGFRTVEGTAPRLLSQSESPLVLPWWIPESDREIILAFYQEVLAEGVMPRIEADWQGGLRETDREFLRNLRARHGSTETLVVVKVRNEGADLQEIAAQPELLAFQHLALAAEFPAEHVSLGRLRELCGLVSITAEDRYRELALELSLPAEDGSLLDPLLRQLLNPIAILECYNLLVDVQADRIDPALYLDTVFRRIVGRLSTSLGISQLIVLGQLVHGTPTGIVGSAPGDLEKRLDLLRDAMIFREGRLVGWASLLTVENTLELFTGHMSRVDEVTHGGPERAALFGP